MMTPDKIKKLYATLQSERVALEQTWRDCFDLTSPIHGQGLTGSDASNAASALTDASQRKAEKFDDTLADCARAAEECAVEPPALVVIGDVVRLRAGLDWVGALAGRQLDPDPLHLQSSQAARQVS